MSAAFEAFRRAESLISQRRPLEALRALETVLAEAPDAKSVHLLAGRAYFSSAQLRRAERSFLRVLELDPTDHYARYALGRTLQRQGRFTEAQTQLRMAAALNPSPEYHDALSAIRARIALRPDI